MLQDKLAYELCLLIFKMREIAWLCADGNNPVGKENLMIQKKERRTVLEQGKGTGI